jgi:hypothetical protein
MRDKQSSFGFDGDENDRARARRSDPFTSHESAERITPHLGTIDDSIYRALLAVGDAGLTSDEISDLTGIKYRSVTPRLKPMMLKGIVCRDGETRTGESGHKQLIWKARS